MAILAYDDVMLREPGLLVPRQKPLGPVRIDRSHWLGSRMMSVVLFSPAHRFVDLVSGRAGTNVGTPVLGYKGGKYCCDFNGTSDAVSFPVDLSGTNSLTVLCNIYPDSLASSGYNMLCEHTADGLANNGGFTFYYQSGTNLITSGHRNNAVTNIKNKYSAPTLSAWSAFGLVHNENLPATNGGENLLYRNGAYEAGNPSASGDTSANFASSNFFIGARNSGSLWYDGAFEYVFIVNGELTVEQVRSAYFDPYQFLIPA